MANINLNKNELRDLIRDIVKKELSSTSFKKDIKDNMSDFVKDNDIIDEKEIKDLVRQMLVNTYKLFWQRQDSWKRNI